MEENLRSLNKSIPDELQYTLRKNVSQPPLSYNMQLEVMTPQNEWQDAFATSKSVSRCNTLDMHE